MGIWLPGYKRVDLGLHGKPFEYLYNPKGLLHRTEGTGLAGAEEAMRAYPSHLGYDPWTRAKHQYISLDLAAYSAMDQSDDDPIYQVEIVGFSKDSRFMPEWMLANIAEDVIKPLADTVGIPPIMIGRGFKDGLDGVYPYLASPQSPQRITYAELRAFSGWLGHQHLPAPDDHWDPGAINMARLIELAYAAPGPKEMINLSGFNGYAIQVTSGPITGQYNIPVGSAWLWDATNRTLDFYPAQSLKDACETYKVLHIGGTGQNVLNLLLKSNN